MKKALNIIGLILASHTVFAQESNINAPANDRGPAAQIVERGQDFAVYEGTKLVRSGDGAVDASNNEWIKAYGSIAEISYNGLAGATFDMIPISSKFKPLFAGTITSTPAAATWKYDHVWIQEGVCLNNFGVVARDDDGVAITDDWECDDVGGAFTLSFYQHFMADDYTWTAADDTYFYYAWCDRSDSFGTGTQSRPDANVRFAKIKY